MEQEIQKAKEENCNLPSPVVLDPAVMIQQAMDHGAIHALRDNSKKDSTAEILERDATAFATQHIIHDPVYQSAKTKKQLQAALGEKQRVSTKAARKSITELREQKRINPDAFQTLHGHNYSTVTDIGHRDKRHFQNGLSHSKINIPRVLHPSSSAGKVLDRVVSTPTSQVDVNLAAINSPATEDSTNTSVPARRGLFVAPADGQTIDTALSVSTEQSLPASPSVTVDNKKTSMHTPATDLVLRSRKRAFKQSRDKNNSEDERKSFRSVTVFTQQKFAVARELAQLEIQQEEDNSAEEETEGEEPKTLSQNFLETLSEFHSEYK